MSLRISRFLFSAVIVLVGFTAKLPGNAQSVPCAAITRNPLVLESLLDSHSQDADSGAQGPESPIPAAQLERLQFSPMVIQPGDALYIEYRGRDFTINADFANGDRTAFDSSPQGSYGQWRKGILPLDLFRASLRQRLVRLRATAKDPDRVLLRNIRIIRAGRPIFEFAKLASYGKPQVKRAVERSLPCVGFDEAPAPGPAVVNYAIPNGMEPKGLSGDYLRPMLPPFPMMMQSTPGTEGNHYKFTGKELDDESGLYNYGARYYGPALGRYLSPDWAARPAAVPYANFGNPQSLNLYTYGRNNPTTFGDPDGHCPDGICINIATMTPAQIDHLAKITPQVIIGQGKAVVNTVTSTANIALNAATHGGIYIPGTTPEIPQLQPKNEAQAAGMISMNGALAAAGVVTGGVAIVDLTSTVTAPSTINLFRAVGSAEADSIESLSAFNAAPNGTEFKGFFFNQADAESFGQMVTGKYGEPTSVYSTEAPADLVNSSPVHNAAREGPGVQIPNEKLNQLSPPKKAQEPN